jgi:hypothetical protein
MLSFLFFELETCHLIYANKSYIIEREDNQWKKDIANSKSFSGTTDTRSEEEPCTAADGGSS